VEKVELAPLLLLDCEMNSEHLVPKTARCTHAFSVHFDRLGLPSDHAEQGTFHIAFTRCSVIRHFVPTNPNKRERQKTPLVVIEMKHKQHVHTVRALNQSPDLWDITYGNQTVVQVHTCDTEPSGRAVRYFQTLRTYSQTVLGSGALSRDNCRD
jgi:hypothetical protein